MAAGAWELLTGMFTPGHFAWYGIVGFYLMAWAVDRRSL